jgi:hypothetical protein|tara:strand:- start:2272 stop:3243 length:972 start_codon:yes stop_codon:yes gene_type:complete
MAIVALITIGMTGAVYAETATVEVPFDSHGQTCSFNEIAVEFQCVWQGMKEVYTMEDLKEYKELLTADRYDQEIQKLNEQALAEIAVEKAKLTPNEKTILAIETKLLNGDGTKDESVLMNLLKKLDTCQQGMDKQTAPIQTAREFEISSFNLWQVNNVDVEGKIGELVMAIEECRGQQALLKVVGEGYSNMPTGDDDYQFSLADLYTEDVQAINFDDHTATHRNVNQALICDDNQHSNVYKAQFGCIVLYDGKTAEQIKAENEARFGTDGKIGYQSEALDRYFEFLDSYGNRYATADDKHSQALIAEPIRDEMFEDNMWFNRE